LYYHQPSAFSLHPFTTGVAAIETIRRTTPNIGILGTCNPQFLHFLIMSDMSIGKSSVAFEQDPDPQKNKGDKNKYETYYQ
jgi:hypothetical protein